MKKINGHEIIQLFEQFSPKQYAMEGDQDWTANWSFK